jgi:hypothetical protein
MRLRKKWLAIYLTIMLLISACVVPLQASAIDDATASATSVSSTTSPGENSGSVDNQATPSSSTDQGDAANDSANVNAEQGAQQDQASGSGDNTANGNPVTESAGGSDAAATSTTSEPASNNSGGKDYIPKCTKVNRIDPSTANTNPVKIDVKENYDITVDGQANATTGKANSAGTNVVNNVGGDSVAAALDGSGNPIESSETGSNGVYAGNEVTKKIDNNGTGGAASGESRSANDMTGNEVNVSPEKSFSSNVTGKVENSNIKVNAELNYIGMVSGLSDALSGDSTATGALAGNELNSGDKSIARGELPLGSDDAANGDVTSVNDSQNSISNDGEALSGTGDASAGNILKDNCVEISPTVKAILNICGDVINSNVTVNLVYNFLAIITGFAKAKTGNSEADGVVANNSIDNSTAATAIGDSSLGSGDGTQGLTGGAVAANDTCNSIDNDGIAKGLSGDAAALNKMLNNVILIAPTICGEVNLLNSIVNSNVIINITYNFWASITGQAVAGSGDTEANGVLADNSIDNKSDALAIGDAPISGSSDCNGVGNAVASNGTVNSISNKGNAGSLSGDSGALNDMQRNLVNLSPSLATAVVLVKQIADDSIVIDVVYNIWACLDGTSNSKSGNADSYGALSDSSIDSNSEAVALARIGDDGSDDSPVALNSSDNHIDSTGDAKSISGEAGASSGMFDTVVEMTGCLDETTSVDNSKGSAARTVSFKAGVAENADAKSGDTTAMGTADTSHVGSNASSKDIFGQPGVSTNESDDDVNNNGVANATSGDAQASTGFVGGSDDGCNNSGDTIKIGGGSMANMFEPVELSGYIDSAPGADYYGAKEVSPVRSNGLFVFVLSLIICASILVLLRPWRFFGSAE